MKKNSYDNVVEILESLGYELGREQKLLCEGIKYNTFDNTVEFDPNSEESVDTSLENNPTVDKQTLPTFPGFMPIEVWSIFKRKDDNSSGGNPLIYALKREKGWKFKTEQDRNNILKQADLIIQKYVKTHNHDISVLVPTTSDLSYMFASMVKKYVTNPNFEILRDVLTKLSTEEIWSCAIEEKNSTFKKIFSNKKDFDNATKLLRKYFNEMDETKNGDFCRHLIHKI